MRVDLHGTNIPALAKNVVSRDAVVWRYMSIGKYLDFIARGAPWFTRAMELRHGDPYEANRTPGDFQRMQRIADARSKDELKVIVSEQGRPLAPAFFAENVSLEFPRYISSQTIRRILCALFRGILLA